MTPARRKPSGKPPAKRNKGPTAGNLEGVQGLSRKQQAERIEAMSESIDELRNIGVSPELIQHIVIAGDLIDAMKGDSLLARLIAHCDVVLAGAQNAWSQCDDPASEKMRGAHLEARAARLVVEWVSIINSNGEIAESIIEQAEAANEY